DRTATARERHAAQGAGQAVAGEPVVLEIRPFDPAVDGYAAVAGVLTRAQPLFPVTAEEVEAGDAMRPAHHRRHRMVALDGGALVGAAWIGHSLWAFVPDQCMVLVTVAPEHRRRGIGTALHRAAEACVSDMGSVVLRAKVSDDDPAGLSFASRLGYREEMCTRMVRLHLGEMEIDGLRSAWERLEHDGFRFIDLSQWLGETGREPGLRAVHALEHAIEADIPHPEGTPFAGPDFEDWCRVLERSLSFRPEGYHLAVAPTGELAGLSFLLVPRLGGTAETGLTGVGRPWRRRGLARALKHRSIAWAHGAGIAEIRTENAEENAGMRALNDALGFVPMPTRVGLRRGPR
ncbi:MAG: N-acetyltransferase family protein, partial [Armatimonadota bacterium]